MIQLMPKRNSVVSPFSIRIFLKDEDDPREVDIVSLLVSYAITSPDYILLVSSLKYAGAAQVLYPHIPDRTACIYIGGEFQCVTLGDSLHIRRVSKALLDLLRYLMLFLDAKEAELTIAGECTVYTMS